MARTSKSRGKTNFKLNNSPYPILKGLRKGATDDLLNDNATLIDEYGSIDFLDTVRDLVVKAVLR